MRQQAGDRERHRDPMIAERIDARSSELRSFDMKAVVKLFDLRTHSLKILDHRGDPVGFLDSQLSRVADLEPQLELRSQYGQYRDLIDQISNDSAAYFIAPLLVELSC